MTILTDKPDTEYTTIQIPDNVLEFIRECESGDHLVEVEAFVTGVSLGRKGKRVPHSNPIECTFQWDINIRGVLHKLFKCWIDGEDVGPCEFHGGSLVLDPGDRLRLYLSIPL